MARKDLGRKPDELDLLLSPSRGLLGAGDDDEASLRNPEVQERFRAHIATKLAKWDKQYAGSSAREDARKRRIEELGIILLDCRKLREGITSVRRADSFAVEAYESSALLSLYASNDPQLSSSLPPLVHSLHPPIDVDKTRSGGTGSQDSLDASLSRLSLNTTSPDPATRAYFIALHLLHSHLLPAFTTPVQPSTPSAVASSHSPLSTFLPSLFSLLRASSLPPPTALYPAPSHPDAHIAHLLSLYHALLHASSASLSTLLSPSRLPRTPPHVAGLLAYLHLPATFHPYAALLRSAAPKLREHALWPAVRRAYRFPPDPTAWLAKGLLFEFEVEMEEREKEGEAGGAGGVGDVRKGGGRTEVSDSWEDDDGLEQEGEEKTGREVRLRAEAERRAAIWVKERLPAR
ncbi:uncharacterized protein JCM10292_007318 [Rhodotorula paludigena]|uniref:uncharacterized protein n=1 Tax=Rhodotorula paludigena TaxID=86838 RepID=UPI00317D025B